MAITVVERFKQESMYGLSAGTKMVAAAQRCFVFRKRCDLFSSVSV